MISTATTTDRASGAARLLGGSLLAVTCYPLLGPQLGMSRALVPWIAGLGVVLLLVLVVALVMGLIDAVRCARRGAVHRLVHSALVVSICAVPFFLAVLLMVTTGVGLSMLLAGMGASGVLILGALAVVVPLVVLAAWLLFLLASAYGIAAALTWRLARDQRIFGAVCAVLQAAFVVNLVALGALASRVGGGSRRLRRTIGWSVCLAVLLPAAGIAAQVVHPPDARYQPTDLATMPGVAEVQGQRVVLAASADAAQAEAVYRAVAPYASGRSSGAGAWAMVLGDTSITVHPDRDGRLATAALVAFGTRPSDLGSGVGIDQFDEGLRATVSLNLRADQTALVLDVLEWMLRDRVGVDTLVVRGTAPFPWTLDGAAINASGRDTLRRLQSAGLELIGLDLGADVSSASARASSGAERAEVCRLLRRSLGARDGDIRASVDDGSGVRAC